MALIIGVGDGTGLLDREAADGTAAPPAAVTVIGTVAGYDFPFTVKQLYSMLMASDMPSMAPTIQPCSGRVTSPLDTDWHVQPVAWT